MFGAMLVSILAGYIFGPGVSGYLESPVYIETYDYVAISEIFHNFMSACMKLVSHLIKNFARTFGLAAVVLLVSGLAVWLTQHKKSKTWHWLPEDTDTRNTLLILLAFSVFSTLCGTQIIMPVRLCLPAYLGLAIIIIILEKFWWQNAKVSSTFWLGGAMTLALVAVITARSFFAIATYQRISRALNNIKNSDQSSYCVYAQEVQSPYITSWNIFQQEETFVNRGTPATLYDKTVIFCE